MAKRRYIQDRATGELIEVSQDYQAPLSNDAGALWGDRHYDGARASDGTDISTRTKHREYMAAHGLTTVDDYKDSWAKAQTARESYYRNGGSIRRADVARAMHQLQQAGRR